MSRRVRRLPRFVHGRDQRPRRFDEIVAREQRRIAEHRVEQQRLVGLRHRPCRTRCRSGSSSSPARAACGVPGSFASKRTEIPSSGCTFTMSRFDAIGVGLDALEDVQRRFAELDRDLGRPLRQPLAGAEVERHARPSPAVEMQPQRDVGLGRRLRDRRPLPRDSRALRRRSTQPAAYCARTTFVVAALGRVDPSRFRGAAESTASASCLRSRTFSAENAIGGSIATSASTCIRWFWTMSRSAPAPS